jgi:alpha-amylase
VRLHQNTGKLRFLKVAIKGFLKIDEGYFDKLGINAIWFTPIVEQIHDGVDEGTGLSYGFHGYWARDWTNLDLTLERRRFSCISSKAHARNQIILDGVINHTGPVTAEDTVWQMTG